MGLFCHFIGGAPPPVAFLFLICCCTRPKKKTNCTPKKKKIFKRLHANLFLIRDFTLCCFPSFIFYRIGFCFVQNLSTKSFLYFSVTPPRQSCSRLQINWTFSSVLMTSLQLNHCRYWFITQPERCIKINKQKKPPQQQATVTLFVKSLLWLDFDSLGLSKHRPEIRNPWPPSQLHLRCSFWCFQAG